MRQSVEFKVDIINCQKYAREVKNKQVKPRGFSLGYKILNILLVALKFLRSLRTDT